MPDDNSHSTHRLVDKQPQRFLSRILSQPHDNEPAILRDAGVRVTRVRTGVLEGTDPHGIGGRPRMRRVLVIQVDTDRGISGLGEAALFQGVPESLEHCARWLIGRDPFDVALFVRTMLYGGLPPYHPFISPTATPTGSIAWAVSGIEMALWDVLGKALEVPVYSLLGGKVREQVRIYLDRSGVVEVADPDAWRSVARRARDDGFPDMKFDIEQVAPELTRDPFNRSMSKRQLDVVAERLGYVREAAGPEAEIALDCHMLYNVPTAVALAEQVEGIRPRWLEDPLPMTNPDALADVRSRTRIPICTGEMFIAEQFRLFLARQACDIVHPDVLFVGGLSEARAVAVLADLNYLEFAMHNNGSGIATMAAAHVAAATPNFIGLEYHFYDAKWMVDIVRREGAFFQDGFVRLTDAPGLGIELNEAVCRQFAASDDWLV